MFCITVKLQAVFKLLEEKRYFFSFSVRLFYKLASLCPRAEDTMAAAHFCLHLILAGGQTCMHIKLLIHPCEEVDGWILWMGLMMYESCVEIPMQSCRPVNHCCSRPQAASVPHRSRKQLLSFSGLRNTWSSWRWAFSDYLACKRLSFCLGKTLP